MFLHGTSTINGQGHLQIGGCDTAALANTFGTPLYVMDEDLIRRRCREFNEAFQASGLKFQVAFASKAFCVMAMCRLIEEEGLTLDVVSDGELYTALQAGFPPERIHFHGNNKTPEEIDYAVEAGIGVFVVDNFHELALLNAIAGSKRKKIDILLRVSPGVEAHTHDYMLTGNEDSKFGFDLGSGAAMEAARRALEQPNLELLGIHSHIGSQIFEVEGFRHAVEKLMGFALAVRDETGAVFRVFNLGGGFGVRYVEGDSPLEIKDYVKAITENIHSTFTAGGYPVPAVWVEPGRTIVGDAGTTLYRIGSMKDLPGIRKYVSVDGGMTDNPRPALYQAKYEALLANRASEANEETVSIAGKCCESGDMLIWDLELPKAEAGDILAVSCTGAYNYSMASNYNRIRRPAVVFVKDGEAEVVVQRESHADLVRNDVIPARLRKQPSEAGKR
ncbi:diaminopimelate decarboxylase [Gorillibacterium sp. sgz500922]|uniref:diaminopimelate decarboxylase n=1 Tax=Gorillibacterium sp. sgz500922 TaxID=3446694 RepID=UPI003F666B82